ncbi:secretin N-terminal domain-containing protein, partial [Pseudomonas asplenii]|uniref:secretin N-terminal domain-containing protein n=1 Tax=Pseudomonas asplenii TaxID=53407 RepID=UPI002360F13E
MKGSGPKSVRIALPLLLMVLGACSNTATGPGQSTLLVDSELGRPLGDTKRGGYVLRDRERAQAQTRPVPRLLHDIPGRAPGGAARSRSLPANPLGEQPVTLNFVEADIQAVVRALSRATGQQFLVDPRVKGSLTLVSEGQVPARQAYDMLLAALRMQGFSVVDVGGIAQVVPEADAKLLGGPIYSADKPAGNGMLTRTFRLQYENAVNLIPVLRPIVSPNNPINAYPGNNTIVVTDYAENLTRVAQLIQGIDTPSAIDTDVVPIHNGIAADIAPMVAELLDAPGGDPTQKIAVIGDPRSNTIIIRAGSPERTELARNLIYKLDNAQSNPSNLHVVYLRNAQAGKLAQALRGLLTGESDSGTTDSTRSALSVMGGTSNGSGQGGQNSSPLASTPSTSTSGSNGSAYGQGSSTTGKSGPAVSDQSVVFSAGGVTIQADATTNTLLISAPEPLYRSLR